MGTYFVRLCYASNYTATTTLQWKIPNACDSLERCYLAAKCQEFAYHDIQVNQYFLTQPRHSPACSLALDWLEKTSSSTWSHHCYPHQVAMGEGSQWRESHLLPEHRSRGGMRIHLLCFNNSVRTPEIHINCIHGKIYRTLKETMWRWGFCFVALTQHCKNKSQIANAVQ